VDHFLMKAPHPRTPPPLIKDAATAGLVTCGYCNRGDGALGTAVAVAVSAVRVGRSDACEADPGQRHFL
jgi:hypothetical protein